MPLLLARLNKKGNTILLLSTIQSNLNYKIIKFIEKSTTILALERLSQLLMLLIILMLLIS
jgi:hypothetical protein